MRDDPYNLQRFVDAQDPVMDHVRAELRAGRKEGHWMWFVFPQVEGLGHSALAQKYSIGSREEADAYLAHPILGPRLRECAELINSISGRSIDQILGYPDNLKFHSSMTLFSIAKPEDAVFQEALQKYFGGEPDSNTIQRLSEKK